MQTMFSVLGTAAEDIKKMTVDLASSQMWFHRDIFI